MEGFTAAPNLEHENLLIFTLLEDLHPDTKKQTEDNIYRWEVQPLDIFKARSQLFVELRATVLISQIFAKPATQL